MNERDHRKLVVIDGRLAFVGGHCVVDTWLGEAQDKEHFADISVRLRGPIVNTIQSVFSENWVEESWSDELTSRIDRVTPAVRPIAAPRPHGGLR